MKVLVACEESQRVTIEFRKLGHLAYSCDLLPCSGGYPCWHIQDDVTKILSEPWDMIIAFPPCTYLSNVGNRWFNVEKYGDKALRRYVDRELAIDFFIQFASNKCRHISIENPVGIMSTKFRKPDQMIQPYWFGDPFEKKTCLWLKRLPRLKPTKILERPQRNAHNPKWYDDVLKLPKEQWSIARSKTFPGIAKAMAEQWGKLDTDE